MSETIDWQTYVDEAVKTAPDNPPHLLVAQGVLGAVSELEEVRTSLVGPKGTEELSDVWWYLALIYHALDELGADMAWARVYDCAPHYDAYRYLDRFCKLMGNAAGKVAFQQKSVDDNPEWWPQTWGGAARHLDALSDTPVEEIWRRNVDKLRDRHGSSFSPADEQDR